MTERAANAAVLVAPDKEILAAGQEAGLVPVVEPELLMDDDHSWRHCRAVPA